MNKRYEAVDGLRAIGTVGILMMHIRGNVNYSIEGYWYNTVVPSFTNFVFLFMMISSFSMCCGYFEKLNKGQIRIDDFYMKRFIRVWPCFAFLVILDLIISPGWESLYESFANLTLAFGLLPNARISVIGVGWFLGVIFLFYMLFPFFTFLIGSKKRAWLSLAVAVVFHYLCIVYFFDENHVGADFSGRINIIYCAVYFLTGGLIYLYRGELEKLAERHSWIILFLSAVLVIIYFRTTPTVLTILPVFSMFLIYALGGSRKLLHNPITHFIGSISLEIYLCHMAVYRILEKTGVFYMIEKDTAAYFFAVITVLAGAVLFAFLCKKVLKAAEGYLEKIWSFTNGGKTNG